MSILLIAVIASICLPFPAIAGASMGGMQAQSAPHPTSTSTDVDSNLIRARTYLQQNQVPEAEALLRKTLGSNPDSAAANDLLGQLLLQQHRFEEALTCFEFVLHNYKLDEAAQRGEHEGVVALALELRKAGNGPAALQCLEHAQAILPDDPLLLTDIGIEADALHDYERAEKALETVLRQNPDDPTALYALARTELDRDNPRRAETLFRAYLGLRPNDASAHYGFGRLFQMQQRTDEAEAEFHRSLDLQPIQTESYYQLGQIALDAHQDIEARAMFEKTLARLPTHGGARTGIGILYYRAKQFDSARGSLEQAIAISPDYEPAHYYLGLTLGRLGEKAASTRELAIATELARKQQDEGKPIKATDP